MPGDTNPPSHWFVAAWPGMANVAVLAAGYLVQKLNLRPVGQMPPRGHFDIQAVEVRSGVITPPRLPRSLLYGGKAPLAHATGEAAKEGPRLTVFVGESQPATGAYAFANELLDKADELGADRIVTFASLASQIHPSDHPRVHAAGTRGTLVDGLISLDVHALEEGQIGGLNGVLLGAAAERGRPGVCLLAEIPFFAAQIPNPKAAAAVLDVFRQSAGLELDLAELEGHGHKIDQLLISMLERMQGGEGDEEPEIATEPPPKAEPKPAEPQLDLKAREKIEKLFEAARQDKSRAVALKRELDKLGVFKQYENRFLDLFKRAE